MFPHIRGRWRRRGFVYLTAVVDWASRRVLAFRVSISLAADAAVEALKEAIALRSAADHGLYDSLPLAVP